MKQINYMNMNQHPAQLSFYKDRTKEFAEIYHAHQGMEMLYVHVGTGTVVVEQQIFELSPGVLFYFKPFQLHRIRVNLGEGQAYVRSLFVFEPSVLDETLAPFPGLRSFFQTLWKDPLAPQMIRGLPADEIDRLFHAHMRSLTPSSPDRLLEEQMLFLTALIHTCRPAVEAAMRLGEELPMLPRKSSSVAEQAMTWIEGHYMEPFELGRLAQEVHLSPNHVSAVFRQTVGSSITEYLTARRIRQACWLLQTSSLSVQEIGQAVGLGNFSYFCQLFKKHVGMTPNRFKRAPRAK
ncbi:AraC family transcriptional regulator [Paenibacillus filicis]|uniref:AraC family transcriptional regulator n=1 Tax=Paenibacillus gyeongsangnamensis TaxID=3388067 RepID=A0ABT4QHG5_9BACL|nr:AraC family transcriptional regulator [Paenibacillus filicis]MCZ8516253.1 AraC family transcriptional regulator [Paenibacillus filicis]